MTPQLQQAIKLLQLSNLELSAVVDHEVEQNPLLERIEGLREESAHPKKENAAASAGGSPEPPSSLSSSPAEPPSSAPSPDPWEQGSSSLMDWGSTSGRGASPFRDSDDAYSLENILTKEKTLREHLTEQLNIEFPDESDRLLGLFLIDQLDESGYCKDDTTAMADLLSCDPDRLEEVRQMLMRFDPLGIGARSLSECLAVQLAERDRLDPAMQTLLENLDSLAARDYKKLMKLCGIDAEDLQDMIAEIQALNPRPATGFASEPTVAIQPDVLMRPDPAGGWIIELNTATLPRVLVNEAYYARIAETARSKEEKDYLSERFASASWLVKSLHQRAQTILKVSGEIVRRQHMFFSKGIMYLKPLVLKDIAEAIEMHESTVSRVTANKFIATPRGVFELKYFFTTSIGGHGGETHSAEAVRHRIKTLIAAEDPQAILSDDTLVDLLKADGIDIARRTVAKYREAMGIASSVQRRREKASPR